MAATYTPVTLAEINDFLKAEKGWVEANVSAREHVRDFPLKRHPGVVIRVYTSIHKDNGIARKKGQDAIRVCAVDTVKGKGLVKSSRVNRTTNWRDNLQKRVIGVLQTTNNRLTKKSFYLQK